MIYFFSIIFVFCTIVFVHEFDSDPDLMTIQEVSTQSAKFIQDKLSVTV